MKVCRIIVDGKPRQISTDALRLMYHQGIVDADTEVLFEGALTRLGDSAVRFEWPEFGAINGGGQSNPNQNQSGPGFQGTPNLAPSGLTQTPGYNAPGQGFYAVDWGYSGQNQPGRRSGSKAGWIVAIIVAVLIGGGVFIGATKGLSGVGISSLFDGGLLSRKNREVCDAMDQYEQYTLTWIAHMEELGRTVESNSEPEGVLESLAAVSTIIGAFRQMKTYTLAYRDNFLTIDVSDCPSDFVVAWRNYITELDGLIDLIDRMTQFNWGALGAWAEFMSIKDTEDQRLEELTAELMEVAERYGWEYN